jgi:hypothetical protein
VLIDAIKPILNIREDATSLQPLVDDPTIDNIRHHILSSDSNKNWSLRSIDSKSTSIYSQNVNLCIEINYTEYGTQCSDSKEAWANSYQNSNATGYWCDIYYRQTHIDRLVFVSVDGDMALLPLPRNLNSKNELITGESYDYSIAGLFDS